MFEQREVPRDGRVWAAFEAVPRLGFLPEDVRPQAEMDAPLPIGHGQTNSQPSTVAGMLELLDVPAGARVLDVGTGSGWTTALLAHLVGPSGRVIGTELVQELRDRGAANLERALQRSGEFASAEIRHAQPGVLGAPEDAPFDRILVSAEPNVLPEELVTQLAPGGIMVIPVAGTMLRVVRDAEGDVATTRHGNYRFVPLR
ncbi:fibrillarin-like rRNA methylase [Pseudoclavibacter endophyticus]|uniref:Protein-L-isoaspartate O-methyltransferase n=1 Tax=Pseudoclavibacter endophyticus TaxID=1778590 RepID=A0A6H9WEM8_9MICO|nr:protein-L-isoaspartate O-methyltransferase [Pseudoclavibacter endophyticus]KAB1649359.1 protein-L-isoaspartate O-methyltransferase [Pseudoclavibacter endophyticus]GGA63214.1 fibrillarin-like rRNA methylase [Pseudoclavibacter endophyticus]